MTLHAFSVYKAAKISTIYVSISAFGGHFKTSRGRAQTEMSCLSGVYRYNKTSRNNKVPGYPPAISIVGGGSIPEQSRLFPHYGVSSAKSVGMVLTIEVSHYLICISERRLPRCLTWEPEAGLPDKYWRRIRF